MIPGFIYVYLILVGYSLSWAGRHRMAIKPGGRGEVGFEALHLGSLVVAAAIVFALPPITGFYGILVLAYAAFAALLTALVTYGLLPFRLQRLRRQIEGV